MSKVYIGAAAARISVAWFYCADKLQKDQFTLQQ